MDVLICSRFEVAEILTRRDSPRQKRSRPPGIENRSVHSSPGQGRAFGIHLFPSPSGRTRTSCPTDQEQYRLPHLRPWQTMCCP